MTVALLNSVDFGKTNGVDVQYDVLRLDRLSQIEARDVPFETVDDCPVCDAHGLTDISRLESSLSTAWCAPCGHLFHRTRPTQEWYLKWYHSSWDTADGSGTTAPAWRRQLGEWRRRARRRLGRGSHVDVYDFCRPVTHSAMRVLDIGCGYGEDLAAFRRARCATFGIEASPHRAAAARELGAQVAMIPVEQVSAATFGTLFDLVVANHVLEHVVDPHQFVARIAAVLKPRGFVCLTVPNLAEDFLLQQFFFALHVHCYSRSSLETLLMRHGFRTWRVLEEHQVRLLAQFCPDGADMPIPPSPPALSAGQVLERCLGPGFGRRDPQQVLCSWTTWPKNTRTQQIYKVQFSDRMPEPVAGKQRIVRLAWTGTPSLPMTFRSGAADGSAPFWVK